jgi:2-deoxy-D-gluconate 3-dehydrogenase
VSHELRTPLNIILGNTQRIQDAHPPDPKDNAVFLASSASDYVHGAVVPVDSGWLCR